MAKKKMRKKEETKPKKKPDLKSTKIALTQRIAGRPKGGER